MKNAKRNIISTLAGILLLGITNTASAWEMPATMSQTMLPDVVTPAVPAASLEAKNAVGLNLRNMAIQHYRGDAAKRTEISAAKAELLGAYRLIYDWEQHKNAPTMVQVTQAQTKVFSELVQAINAQAALLEKAIASGGKNIANHTQQMIALLGTYRQETAKSNSTVKSVPADTGAAKASNTASNTVSSPISSAIALDLDTEAGAKGLAEGKGKTGVAKYKVAVVSENSSRLGFNGEDWTIPLKNGKFFIEYDENEIYQGTVVDSLTKQPVNDVLDGPVLVLVAPFQDETITWTATKYAQIENRSNQATISFLNHKSPPVSPDRITKRTPRNAKRPQNSVVVPIPATNTVTEPNRVALVQTRDCAKNANPPGSSRALGQIGSANYGGGRNITPDYDCYQ